MRETGSHSQITHRPEASEVSQGEIVLFWSEAKFNCKLWTFFDPFIESWESGSEGGQERKLR